MKAKFGNIRVTIEDRFGVMAESSSGRYWIVEQTPQGEKRHNETFKTAQAAYDHIKQLKKTQRNPKENTTNEHRNTRNDTETQHTRLLK